MLLLCGFSAAMSNSGSALTFMRINWHWLECPSDREALGTAFPLLYKKPKVNEDWLKKWKRMMITDQITTHTTNQEINIC